MSTLRFNSIRSPFLFFHFIPRCYPCYQHWTTPIAPHLSHKEKKVYPQRWSQENRLKLVFLHQNSHKISRRKGNGQCKAISITISIYCKLLVIPRVELFCYKDGLLPLFKKLHSWKYSSFLPHTKTLLCRHYYFSVHRKSPIVSSSLVC